MPHPCGRCPPCKKRRVDGWVFRLKQEENVSSSAHFVTLTYDTAHVPISPNGFMTLDKGEFPRFMKRLRKLCEGYKLRYYAVGEYGSLNKRPHYHAIIFNTPSDGYFFDAWKLSGVHIGTVHVGQVSSNSVAYTMKYIDKSNYRASHGRDDRVPEFSICSKGLGLSYVSPATVSYHNADLSRMYLSNDGGHKIAMPRYYRERIFDEDARAFQQSLAEIASGVSNSEKYAEFLRLYGHIDGYTYDKYLESERLGSVKAFYSNQKTRNI